MDEATVVPYSGGPVFNLDEDGYFANEEDLIEWAEHALAAGDELPRFMWLGVERRLIDVLPVGCMAEGIQDEIMNQAYEGFDAITDNDLSELETSLKIWLERFSSHYLINADTKTLVDLLLFWEGAGLEGGQHEKI